MTIKMDTVRERRPLAPLLDVSTIFLEPVVPDYARGREILEKYPNAERIEVKSHWAIPELHGNEGAVKKWIANKRSILVLGVKKSLSMMNYERSSDFIAPSHANGCAMACAYCLAGGILITTLKGLVPVEQIRDGDHVVSFDSSLGQLATGVVSGTACREADEVLEIEIGNTTLCVTAEHPLMTRRGWVKAGDLTEDDEILCDVA